MSCLRASTMSVAIQNFKTTKKTTNTHTYQDTYRFSALFSQLLDLFFRKHVVFTFSLTLTCTSYSTIQVDSPVLLQYEYRFPDTGSVIIVTSSSPVP